MALSDAAWRGLIACSWSWAAATRTAVPRAAGGLRRRRRCRGAVMPSAHAARGKRRAPARVRARARRVDSIPHLYLFGALYLCRSTTTGTSAAHAPNAELHFQLHLQLPDLEQRRFATEPDRKWPMTRLATYLVLDLVYTVHNHVSTHKIVTS